MNTRVNTGWHLHALLFGALAAALPDRVQAGNGLMHSMNCYGQDAAGRTYNAHLLTAGGRCASEGRDGIGRNCFPSSARNVAVELFELRVPVVVRQRALRPDSAGVGWWRGAFGHEIILSRLPGFPRPVDFYFSPHRLRYPPRGLAGGDDGPCTEIFLHDAPLAYNALASGHVVLQTDDDRLTEWLPGGAGFGDPAARDPAAVQADLRSGLVTPEAAARTVPHGVAVRDPS